jgi:hypothetical protein
MIGFFARRYGAHPAHLAGHLLLFALAFWAISTMLDMRAAGNWLLWLVAAAVLHDLVLLPLYAVPDRVLARGLAGRGAPRVRVINHIRVPVAVSGVLLLVSFPLVLERAPGNIARVAGFAPSGYLAAWLGLSAGAFLLSAIVYGVRLARVARGGQRDELQEPVAPGDGEDVRAG